MRPLRDYYWTFNEFFLQTMLPQKLTRCTGLIPIFARRQNAASCHCLYVGQNRSRETFHEVSPLSYRDKPWPQLRPRWWKTRLESPFTKLPDPWQSRHGKFSINQHNNFVWCFRWNFCTAAVMAMCMARNVALWILTSSIISDSICQFHTRNKNLEYKLIVQIVWTD